MEQAQLAERNNKKHNPAPCFCSFSLTSCLASSVLSPLGSGRSMANTTQLAMMVRRTVYSKGGHSIRNFVSRRIRFDSRRMKREVGPSFFSSSFFFFAMVSILHRLKWCKKNYSNSNKKLEMAARSDGLLAWVRI